MSCKVRWFRGLLALTVATAALSAGAVRAQTLLRWKFQPGQTLHYEVQQDVKTKGNVGAQAIGMTMKMTMDMTWKVDAVDAQGNGSLTMTLDRVRMKADLPQGMSMEYDSASDKEPEGLAKMLASSFKAMLKQPITMKTSPRGKMSDVKVPAAMQGLLKQANNPAGEMLSAEGMQKLGGMSALPEEPIKPGKTWSEKATVKSPMGNMEVETNFRYLGNVQQQGQTLEKIAQKMTMKLAGGEKKLPMEIKKQEGKGTLLFDNVAGHPVSNAMKMNMTMELEVVGQKIERDVETDMQMKLVTPKSGE